VAGRLRQFGSRKPAAANNLHSGRQEQPR